MPALPSHARVVVVGGGIVGCSTAYHLAGLGIGDVLLLEQGQLTCGTTWHAAGLVGQMRPNRNMTRMSRYGIGLYASLEAETGLATGWKQCGSVNVAGTAERMQVLRRQRALAQSFGVECHEISPREAGERFPLLRTDDLHGAIWLPGDGKANPADLTMSLARGARARGVRIVEGVEVVGVTSASLDGRRRATGVTVRDADGTSHAIGCETLVVACGQWSRQVGAMAGVQVPLWSAEHFYVVTDRIEGVHPMLPVMRDPDGFIYYKEEVGGLLMGGFEPKAKPWTVDPIPSSFRFQLLDEDWDQFEPLMAAAIHRTPCLETARVKMLLNGPESFTPDGNFILGEAPELAGCFVAAGFNSAGIANAGGAGRLLAEWIVAGEPQSDLSDVDIRRFQPHQTNRRALAERTGETLGLHYAMRWPRQELETARPLRTSPLHDALADAGAVFGSKGGWERALYFVPGEVVPSESVSGGGVPRNVVPGGDAAGRAAAAVPTLGRPGWLPHVEREQRATREAVGLYDQTSFGKLLVLGRHALALLQRVSAAEMDVAVGRIVYTPWLNARGGIEADLTVQRLAADRFLVVTGSAQTTRDADWLARHTRAGEDAHVVETTAQTAVLSLMGPNAATLLARVSPDDLSKAAIPFAHVREIDLGHARVRAARMSYVGGPGFELYVPIETARHVRLALHGAADGLGLVDCGYHALDALRIEAGRRAWGHELGPDESPHEAGTMAAVALAKPGGFVGHDALVARLAEPPSKRLVALRFDDPDAWAWGGEPLTRDGEAVGEITSAGWSRVHGRCLALGWLRGPSAAASPAGRLEAACYAGSATVSLRD